MELKSMGKIIYLPLEHIESRYTTHMDRDILKYLENSGREFVRVYPDIPSPKTMKAGSFLDAEFTIRFKAAQIEEVARLYREDVIDSGDIIWSSDLWHPGLPESIAYMNYFAKKDVKLRGLIHAGSFTDTDFVRDMERVYKGFEEILFDITDTIYVASNFIKNDVIKKRIVDPNKIVVSGLPIDEKGLDLPKVEKEDIVIFNGRNVDEKQPYLFEIMKEKLPYKFINTQQKNYTKEEYYNLLNKSKVVVSFALQENFGYGIQEAVKLGCVPVLPNRLVYPEIYPQQNLYNTFEESIKKVKDAIEGNLSCPIPKIKTNKEIFKIWFND